MAQAHVQRIFNHLLCGTHKVSQDGPEIKEHSGQHKDEGVEQNAYNLSHAAVHGSDDQAVILQKEKKRKADQPKDGSLLEICQECFKISLEDITILFAEHLKADGVESRKSGAHCKNGDAA